MNEQIRTWLIRISTDLRAAGDVALVHLSEEEGVGPAGISLSDELWLVAKCLEVPEE